LPKDGPRVIAVLDWELSTLGHPFADLAYQSMQWRLPQLRLPRPCGVDRAALGLPSERTSLSLLAKAANRQDRNWTFFLAFSFFRLAAICQGVYRRARRQRIQPEKAKTYGQAVKCSPRFAVE